MAGLADQLAAAFKSGHKIGSGTSANDTGLQTKAEVNYRPADDTGSCAECLHFDGTSKCDIVAGKISGSMVCDKFEASTDPNSAAPTGEPITAPATGAIS